MRIMILTSASFLAIICCANLSPGQTRSEPVISTVPSVASVSSSSQPAATRSDLKVNSDHTKSEAKRHYKTAVKYGRAKLFEQAAANFLLAIRLKPDYGDAYHGLGHAYFDLKRWKASIEALEQAVKINPKDDEAYAMLGKAYLNSRLEASDSASRHAPELQKIALDVSSGSAATRRPQPVAENIPTNTYHVGAGDVLEVRVQNSPTDQQSLFTVGATGLLDHPILSEPLKVVGLTTEEISRRIEFDLKRRALNENPKVLVGVREYSSHTVLISGLVKEPGTKVLRRDAIPLYVVVADAQPLPEAGRAIVKSHQKGETVVLDLTDPNAMELLVHPGSVISLERNPPQFFYIGGEVKVPGEKPFRRRLKLTQAILSAGGVNKKGKQAELAREGAPGILGVTKYKLKDIYEGQSPDPEVFPGDRITVNN